MKYDPARPYDNYPIKQLKMWREGHECQLAFGMWGAQGRDDILTTIALLNAEIARRIHAPAMVDILADTIRDYPN